MATILDRLPSMTGDYYQHVRDTDVVELLWDDVTYINDDGDEIELAIFLNEADLLVAVEEQTFKGHYHLIKSGQMDLIEDEDTNYFNEEN